MPIWAIIYCILILCSGIGTIAVLRPMRMLYVLGEIVSVLCAISFFLFYYDLIARPQSLLLAVSLLVFPVYWELWENRALMQREMVRLKQDLAEDGMQGNHFPRYVYGAVVIMSLPFFYVAGAVLWGMF